LAGLSARDADPIRDVRLVLEVDVERVSHGIRTQVLYDTSKDDPAIRR
jgi:hypothetical protein